MVSLENIMDRVELMSEAEFSQLDLNVAGRTLIEDVVVFMTYLADYNCDFFECVIQGDIELKLRRIPQVVQLDPDAE